jgi:hypothetical protein
MADVLDYYQVTRALHSPLVFCDDMSEVDVWQIWHSYVVTPQRRNAHDDSQRSHQTTP